MTVVKFCVQLFSPRFLFTLSIRMTDKFRARYVLYYASFYTREIERGLVVLCKKKNKKSGKNYHNYAIRDPTMVKGMTCVVVID